MTRPTRDTLAGLAYLEVKRLAARVLEQVRRIAAIPVEDGLTYDTAGARAAVISDGEEYSGVRVAMTATLARARLAFHVDVSIGDPVWPPPTRPRCHGCWGGPPIVVRGYPLPMVHAEKIVTAVDRGLANTRWRDFGDIWTLTQVHLVSGADLETALGTVARHCGSTVTPLAEVLDGYAESAQQRWRSWRHKMRAEQLPDDFASVLRRVAAFADPALRGQVGACTWTPSAGAWLAEPAPVDG